MQNVNFLSPTTAKAGFDSRPEQDSLVVSRKSRQALVPEMEMTTHPHLNPSLRTSRAIPPLHLYASMVLTRVPLLYTSLYGCTAQACTGVADTLDFLISPLLYSRKNYEAHLFKSHLTTLSTAEII